MNDLSRAVAEQESAVSLSPGNAAWWMALADLYQAQGLAEKSSRERERESRIHSEGNGRSGDIARAQH